MDFSQVKEIRIPEGDVTEIRDANGTVLWQKRDMDYGTITYRYLWTLTRTYKIKTLDDFNLLGSEAYDAPSTIRFSDGTSISRSSITRFDFGQDFPTELPKNFLGDCSALNYRLDIPQGVTRIREYFLHRCQAFNSPVTLPDTLLRIDGGFMVNCSAFAQELTLPSSIRFIDSLFLNGVQEFTGPLVINCSAVPSSGNISGLLSYASTVRSYSIGVTIMGPGAAAWRAAMPDIHGGDSGLYFRHLVL